MTDTALDLPQGGAEKLSDEATEGVLEKVIRLLAYISDKDLFSEFYRKRLSRRLLIEKSSAEHHERGVLSQLKQQCGAQFTAKVRPAFRCCLIFCGLSIFCTASAACWRSPSSSAALASPPR